MFWFNGLIDQLCHKFKWQAKQFELVQFSRDEGNEFRLTLSFPQEGLVSLVGNYAEGQDVSILVYSRGGVM